MRLLNVVTSIERDELVPLQVLKRLYNWSERNQRIFERFFKFRSVCLHQGAYLGTTLQDCLRRLTHCNPELIGGVDYLIYSHSSHNVIPFDRRFLSDIAIDLLHCRPETLSVTQGSCASGLLSVGLLQSLMSVGRPKRAILLTGEKCFHPHVQYEDQTGIFGEAATAVYFSSYAVRGGVLVSSVASYTTGDMSTRVVDADLQMRNRYDRVFIPTMVATIKAALDDAGATLDQIGAILPYHVSPPTFDRIALAIDLSPDLVVRSNLYDIGHCFCGDAFINLSSWLNNATPCASRPYLLALAAGVAGSFSAMLLKQEMGYELHS